MIPETRTACLKSEKDSNALYVDILLHLWLPFPPGLHSQSCKSRPKRRSLLPYSDPDDERVLSSEQTELFKTLYRWQIRLGETL